MTNKAELQKQGSKMLTEMLTLKAQCEAFMQVVESMPDDKPKGRQKPAAGQYYYFLDCDLEISLQFWRGNNIDKGRYAAGNVYLTQEAAQKARDRKLLEVELRDFAGFEPDWSDREQEKWELFYCHTSKEWKSAHALTLQTLNAFHFPSQERLNEAIEHFGERLNLLLN